MHSAADKKDLPMHLQWISFYLPNMVTVWFLSDFSNCFFINLATLKPYLPSLVDPSNRTIFSGLCDISSSSLYALNIENTIQTRLHPVFLSCWLKLTECRLNELAEFKGTDFPLGHCTGHEPAITTMGGQITKNQLHQIKSLRHNPPEYIDILNYCIRVYNQRNGTINQQVWETNQSINKLTD